MAGLWSDFASLALVGLAFQSSAARNRESGAMIKYLNNETKDVLRASRNIGSIAQIVEELTLNGRALLTDLMFSLTLV